MPRADRLGTARRLLSALAAAAVLAVVLTAGLQAWHQRRPVPIALARCLAVTDLALAPAGTPARHPQLRHAAVDLRQAPPLPPLPKGVP
ncbi:MAG: hypothetical protein V2L15_03950 [Desulfobacteraceae bacterium]|jgi:hypothetical protein|nr:hypothetical protein [Desulfobacteraceae bacterium]